MALLPLPHPCLGCLAPLGFDDAGQHLPKPPSATACLYCLPQHLALLPTGCSAYLHSPTAEATTGHDTFGLHPLTAVIQQLCFPAGVRYVFVGKLFESRPSYHLLGLLLFVQLGITSGTWAVQQLASSLTPQAKPQGHAQPLHGGRQTASTPKGLPVILEVGCLSLALSATPVCSAASPVCCAPFCMCCALLLFCMAHLLCNSLCCTAHILCCVMRSCPGAPHVLCNFAISLHSQQLQ